MLDVFSQFFNIISQIFFLENTILGNPNEMDKCKRTEVVINTYEEILRTINFVDQKNQRQKQKYEDFIKDYVERIGRVGEELAANCKRRMFYFHYDPFHN